MCIRDRYSLYHRVRKSSNISVDRLRDWISSSLEGESVGMGSFNTILELANGFKKQLGVRGTISLSEEVYVNGLELIALAMSANAVVKSKYSKFLRPTVL